MTFPFRVSPMIAGSLLMGLAALIFPRFATAADDAPSGKFWAFVGTYTQGGESRGIYRFEFDPATGSLTNRQVAAETTNPSFLAIHPDRKSLYCVGEVSDFGGKPSGAVAAFSLDPKTGALASLNQQSSGGAGPCHLVVDKEGKHVLVANYGGGSVSALAIESDGRLGETTAHDQHQGTSVDKARQEAPHAHSVNLDAANKYAVVADLGLDKVFVSKYDTAKGTLTPNDPPFASTAPGAGPRHFAFHPNGKNAYVINEMACTITAWNYDAENGTLKELQTVSTLPSPLQPGYSTAEVVVHPSGKFVFGSNRGHNSIAVFGCDPQTGKLTPLWNQFRGIKTPRNFVVDPSGRFLLVANQDGKSIVVFRIDPKAGALTPVGEKVEVASPVCIRFVPIEK